MTREYKLLNGEVVGGRSIDSIRWKDSFSLARGDELSGGRWCVVNVYKKIRNNDMILFWNKPWLGGDVVKECFSRLFNLALEKNVSLSH